MSWLDFGAVRANIPVEFICEKYGHPLGESGEGRLRGQCPLPSHKGSRRDCFVVNRERNTYICFGCGAAGSVIDLLCALENLKPKDAARKLVELWKEAGEAKEVPAAKPEPSAAPSEEAKPAETKGYMKAQDEWIADVLMRKPDETEVEWFRRAKKKIKEELLASYKNGKLAGAAEAKTA